MIPFMGNLSLVWFTLVQCQVQLRDCKSFISDQYESFPCQNSGYFLVILVNINSVYWLHLQSSVGCEINTIVMNCKRSMDYAG